MLGLINRSIQCFVRDTYGQDVWAEVAKRAGSATIDFEPLAEYDGELTRQLIVAASGALHKPQSEMLEDLGLYLASYKDGLNFRRLLRFGGDTFLEFLHSLVEMKDRVRLAIDGLELPDLELREHYSGHLSLSVLNGPNGAGHVLTGLLRAMADDYGTLALLENAGRFGNSETISIQLLEMRHSGGRSFQLAANGTVG